MKTRISRWNEAEWPRLKDRLAAVFLTRTRDAWCQLFAGVDACVSPVLDLDEASAHPQNADRGAFVERDGAVQPAPAPRFSRTPSEIDATPPGGSAAVLEHWGFAAGEIDALRASGAI